LIITRFNGKNITVQLIDGYYVQNPFGVDNLQAIENRGNTVNKGVEKNSKGEIVAYHVMKDDLQSTRVLAKSRSGRVMAWMFIGKNHKLADDRGRCAFASTIESIHHLDRFKDATITSAEEQNKIPYVIEHGQNSTGENPLTKSSAAAAFSGKGTAPETSFDYCESNDYANKIALMTDKSTINMPVDSKLARANFTSDIAYKDFFGSHADVVFAANNLPPEVAMDKFGGAYSGSRAAIKAWEHLIFTDRETLMTEQFYKPIYIFWLEMMVAMGKIEAPGFLDAIDAGNNVVVEAYANSRFIGVNVPHIDPLKEIKAARERLGKNYENVPLTTGEQETEIMNAGDFAENIKIAEDEIQIADDAGFGSMLEQPIQSTGLDNANIE
jgi:hypothetical protein